LYPTVVHTYSPTFLHAYNLQCDGYQKAEQRQDSSCYNQVTAAAHVITEYWVRGIRFGWRITLFETRLSLAQTRTNRHKPAKLGPEPSEVWCVCARMTAFLLAIRGNARFDQNRRFSLVKALRFETKSIAQKIDDLAILKICGAGSP
jgi:hypothetical protein